MLERQLHGLPSPTCLAPSTAVGKTPGRSALGEHSGHGVGMAALSCGARTWGVEARGRV